MNLNQNLKTEVTIKIDLPNNRLDMEPGQNHTVYVVISDVIDFYFQD